MTFLLADTLLKAQLMSRDRQQKDRENNRGCLHPSIPAGEPMQQLALSKHILQG